MCVSAALARQFVTGGTTFGMSMMFQFAAAIAIVLMLRKTPPAQDRRAELASNNFA
jgi:hypothetical protein